MPTTVTGGQWYDVATTVHGSTIETRIDGQLVDTVEDPTFATGRVGFRENGDEAAEFDDVRVTVPDGSVLLADDFSDDLSRWDRPAPELQGHRINDTSCGGQPSFVSQVPTTEGTRYLFASDLWNGRASEALAGYFWRPLDFRPDGSIAPYPCDARAELSLTAAHPVADRPVPQRDASSVGGLFRPYADGSPSFRRAQTFTVGRDGHPTAVHITTYQLRSPNAPLILELTRVAADGSPGAVLARREVPSDAVGWSPREAVLRVDRACGPVSATPSSCGAHRRAARTDGPTTTSLVAGRVRGRPAAVHARGREPARWLCACT